VNPTAIGTRTEGILLAELLKRGKNVLLPFGGGARYDLAYDEGGQLIRVQCKTGSYIRGCISFNTRSLTREGRHVGYAEDADFFGIYSEYTGKAYFVPVAACARGKGSLRVEPSLNNQARNVLWAADYELNKVL
jgi:hypothetical protein